MKIEMKNIYKSFGDNEVLKDVNLNIRGGEVLALIGENGAGKSTLMNILGGVLPMDKGSVEVEGKKAVFHVPADSMEAGIAFIHQELNLINDLPIYENMFIGREPKTKYGTLDLEQMIKETQEVFIRMNIHLNPKAMVRDLDASYKQIVEIARAMMMNASIIIMDEPTTSLTETEIERVFIMMKTLKEHNVGIIFISHKLKEVMEICDRYMVLRDGVVVGDGHIKEVTTDHLARLMVGHDVRTEALQRNIEKGEEVLRVEELSRENVFRDVTFSAYKGEILGITGLLGDGRSELFLSIFGADRYHSGKVFLEGKPVRIRNTVDAMKLGIGYLPRNRKENGIIKDMNIFENASIVTWPKFARSGIINTAAQDEEFEKQVRRLH
ncbi:MAG TPA: sugar ABC transporter ATP-binding protein, partial [Bacteroidales bacterium]|nr:sugar ABC transporter ATP-binding protein [Bacteroidales bacterium]